MADLADPPADALDRGHGLAGGPLDAADLAAPSSTPAAPEVAAGNYAVNFGAYASEADANAVIARLKQAQLPGFSEPRLNLLSGLVDSTL